MDINYNIFIGSLVEVELNENAKTLTSSRASEERFAIIIAQPGETLKAFTDQLWGLWTTTPEEAILEYEKWEQNRKLNGDDYCIIQYWSSSAINKIKEIVVFKNDLFPGLPDKYILQEEE